MYYPRFEYTAQDGKKHQVTESKSHIIRVFKPGQEIEVIVSPLKEARIADSILFISSILAFWFLVYFLSLSRCYFGDSPFIQLTPIKNYPEK
ncbi:MAG TPA: hypothetical protein DDW65_18655 [Firmicutes bacterium]|nr:hypothetical protein [Bacillota bacterium]